MPLLGVIAILIAGAGISSALVADSLTSVLRSRALLELLELTRGSVENYAMSASEILSGCPEELIRRCGYRDESGFPRSFLELAERCEIPDPESEKLFFDFARSFGKDSRQRQSEACSMCIDAMRARLYEMERQLPVRRKVIISVCGAAALVCVILLI